MGADDLGRVLNDVPEQSMVLRLRILADVHNGLLFTHPTGSLDTGHVPRAERGDYFGCFRAMCRESWLMEAAPGRGGRRRIIFTTLGEFVYRRTNVDAYRSQHAFGMRDGQISASQAVPR